jgi:hypothetical protein
MSKHCADFANLATLCEEKVCTALSSTDGSSSARPDRRRDVPRHLARHRLQAIYQDDNDRRRFLVVKGKVFRTPIA